MSRCDVSLPLWPVRKQLAVSDPAEDMRDAVAWVKGRAGLTHDPNQVTIGDSAGGHPTMLHGFKESQTPILIPALNISARTTHHNQWAYLTPGVAGVALTACRLRRHPKIKENYYADLLTKHRTLTNVIETALSGAHFQRRSAVYTNYRDADVINHIHGAVLLEHDYDAGTYLNHQW